MNEKLIRKALKILQEYEADARSKKDEAASKKFFVGANLHLAAEVSYGNAIEILTAAIEGDEEAICRLEI